MLRPFPTAVNMKESGGLIICSFRQNVSMAGHAPVSKSLGHRHGKHYSKSIAMASKLTSFAPRELRDRLAPPEARCADRWLLLSPFPRPCSAPAPAQHKQQD